MDLFLGNIENNIWGNAPVIANTKTNKLINENKLNEIQSLINSYQLSSHNYFLLFIILGYFVVNLLKSNRLKTDNLMVDDINNFRYTDLVTVIALSMVTYALTNFKQTGTFYLGYIIGLFGLFVTGYSKNNKEKIRELSFDFKSITLFIIVIGIIIINLMNSFGTQMFIIYLIILSVIATIFITILKKNIDRNKYLEDNESDKISKCYDVTDQNYITLNIGTIAWLISLLIIFQTDNSLLNMIFSIIHGLCIGLYVAYFSL